MTVIVKSCENCKHDGPLNEDSPCYDCDEFSKWQESELSKCQRKLKIAIGVVKDIVDNFDGADGEKVVAQVALDGIEEIDDE